MIRSLLAVAAAISVSACTLDGANPFSALPPLSKTPAQPQPDTSAAAAAMARPGTCFAYVTADADGTYTLLTGVGNGTIPAQGVPKRGLSAAAVDAAVQKEAQIMKINPECLSTYISPRPATPAA